MINRPQFVLTSLLILIVINCSLTYPQSRIDEIPLPSVDFERVESFPGSFQQWLRELPLKPKGSDVLNYRGGVFKSGEDTAVAFVTDINIKNRRLEQCMDILIRFYSDFLQSENQMNTLILPLPGGYWIKWTDWKKGYRPIFKGIDVTLKKTSFPDSSYKNYQSYLNTVYSESHTQQFYHAYKKINRSDIMIGDMIIRKGTKGHAVMVVDLAKNDKGEMIALIGNGDTPACQFFLLNHKRNSPWIPLHSDQINLELPLKRKIGWDGLRRFSRPKL